MKVSIEITRKTQYAATVDMSREDYDRLSAMLDGSREDRRKAEKEINGMVDDSDWQDDDFDYLDTFQSEDEDEEATP